MRVVIFLPRFDSIRLGKPHNGVEIGGHVYAFTLERFRRRERNEEGKRKLTILSLLLILYFQGIKTEEISDENLISLLKRIIHNKEQIDNCQYNIV